MKRWLVFLLVLSLWASTLITPAQEVRRRPIVAAASGSPYITGETLGALANDFTGCLGFKIVTSSTPPTVTALGRWKVAGNTGTHTVRLLDCDTSGTSTLVASASIDTTLGTSGTYQYVSITPVALSATKGYCVLSEEVFSGDQWYNNTTVITSTKAGVASSVSNAYVSGGAPCTDNEATPTADRTYGPVNFKSN